MSEWEGASEEAIDLLDRTLEGCDLERRIMFGLPAYRFQGNMMVFVYGDQIVVRLGEADRKRARELWGDEAAFVARGRRMKEYVCLPLEIMADDQQLDHWIELSLSFVGSLPAKG